MGREGSDETRVLREESWQNVVSLWLWERFLTLIRNDMGGDELGGD